MSKICVKNCHLLCTTTNYLTSPIYNLASNEFGETQTGKVLLSTKEDSQDVIQELSHPMRSQILEVSGPKSFCVEAFDKLSKYSFDAIAH